MKWHLWPVYVSHLTFLYLRIIQLLSSVKILSGDNFTSPANKTSYLSYLRLLMIFFRFYFLFKFKPSKWFTKVPCPVPFLTQKSLTNVLFRGSWPSARVAGKEQWFEITSSLSRDDKACRAIARRRNTAGGERRRRRWQSPGLRGCRADLRGPPSLTTTATLWPLPGNGTTANSEEEEGRDSHLRFAFNI